MFNIKQLFSEDYIILGEPILKKYTLYLDYGEQKMGFAVKRANFQKQFINVVSLIRFLVIVFTLGIIFVIQAVVSSSVQPHVGVFATI